jgi:hypothetical protein
LKLGADLNLNDILHLSQALSTNTSLESLDLSGNNFASNSCLALGRALEHNSTLRKLNISDNARVDSLAVENFLIGAQKNIGLRELHLPRNAQCSSSCIQHVIEKMPRLVTLFSNIFGTGLGSLQADTSEVMYYASQNGLFNALKSHYALCNLSFGHNYYGGCDAATSAFLRRNRRTPDSIYLWAPEILAAGVHEKGINAATLKAAYNFPKRALSVSDFIVMFKGNTYSVANELHRKISNSTDAHNLFREVRALSLCIYVRDVALKDTPEAEKFIRFCSVMCLNHIEKISLTSHASHTKLERVAEEYYRSAPDPFESEIDNAITLTNASLNSWHQQMIARRREEDEARTAAGYDDFEPFF